MTYCDTQQLPLQDFILFYLLGMGDSFDGVARADTEGWGDDWVWVHDVKFTKNR